MEYISTLLDKGFRIIVNNNPSRTFGEVIFNGTVLKTFRHRNFSKSVDMLCSTIGY